jgi:hypothetical protein
LRRVIICKFEAPKFAGTDDGVRDREFLTVMKNNKNSQPHFAAPDNNTTLLTAANVLFKK